MVDLCCGNLGWSRPFAARGWKVIGVDLVEPRELPPGVSFVKANILAIASLDELCRRIGAPRPCFGAASTPCEEFAVFGMAHFHPNPPRPELGIKLFNHARALYSEARLLHVLENVREARQFIGPPVHHCGPYYLWGTAVPPLMPQGIKKGFGAWDRKQILATGSSKSMRRRLMQKEPSALIPPELSNCVADYVERLLA